jgi:hypothetical protein
VQGFSGYGQSLIDYNYSQKSLGAGFLVDFNGRAAQDARRQHDNGAQQLKQTFDADADQAERQVISQPADTAPAPAAPAASTGTATSATA